MSKPSPTLAVSLVQQLGLLCRLVSEPSRSIERIGRDAPLAAPLALFGLGGAALQHLTLPYIQAALRSTLPGRLDADQIAQALEMARGIQLLSMAFFPVVMAFKWLVLALLIYIIVHLGDGVIRFRQAYSLVAFASLFVFLQASLILLILSLKGVESVGGPADLQPPIGMNLLFADVPPLLYSFLQQLNPFEFWYAFTLVVGVQQLNPGFSRAKSCALVAPIWAFAAALQSALASAGG